MIYSVNNFLVVSQTLLQAISRKTTCRSADQETAEQQPVAKVHRRDFQEQ